MTKNVFAGKWEIAAENGMNKSIARFPDVCMSPPSPPAGPIPIPYPNTSFSNTLKSGSSTVKIGGKGAALAQKSYYQESVLGNEAATRAFGAAVITHQITGKTFFQAWCMDVKFEGKNVCRHLDLTTSNHASDPPSTPPAPAPETQTFAESEDLWKEGKCPCCHEALHEWQKDESDKPFPLMKEKDFWDARAKELTTDKARDRFKKALDLMLPAKDKARAASAAGGDGCPNVHKTEDGPCALYFDVPRGAKSKYTSPRSGTRVERQAKSGRNHFDDNGLKDIAVKKWTEANTKPGQPPPDFKGKTMHHKTPMMAGGCATANNVLPDQYLKASPKECQDIEAWQKTLEQLTTA
ncbi:MULTISPECIES: PAAR-like domain-containing protein [Mesorhizobium]|uniref:PAAR-like domain-containing protein n=1 Tax=Mesorhizobium TaxID=68287 RepID=UPI0010A961EE|nr:MULTISPECIES: PAAR-like domain-containing protein [Mesorhizobium]